MLDRKLPFLRNLLFDQTGRETEVEKCLLVDAEGIQAHPQVSHSDELSRIRLSKVRNQYSGAANGGTKGYLLSEKA